MMNNHQRYFKGMLIAANNLSFKDFYTMCTMMSRKSRRPVAVGSIELKVSEVFAKIHQNITNMKSCF